MSPTKSSKMKPSKSNKPRRKVSEPGKVLKQRKMPKLLIESGVEMLHNGVRLADFNDSNATQTATCPFPASKSNVPLASHVNDAIIPAQDSASHFIPILPSNDILLHSQIPVSVPISGDTDNATRNTYYGTGPSYPPITSFPQPYPLFRREDFNSSQGDLDNIFSMANQSYGYVTNNDFPSVNPYRPAFYDPHSIPDDQTYPPYPPNIDIDYFNTFPDDVTYNPYQNLG
ncbi:hypothetical protein BYT27DRAFT_6642031 [Phlegmacium glaucopus]|nr:hypothetical protein BYT27DRAFT_6642031 [Phlegmacium glaucopus]